MEISAELVAPGLPADLFAYVADLDRYPEWMALVHRVERIGPDPIWEVELRTTLGPMARSKRLRMQRTELIADRRVVFERAEIDGREHSPWVLSADLEVVDDTTTRLVMNLHYGGSMWTGGALRLILDEQIRTGSQRLVDIVSGRVER